VILSQKICFFLNDRSEVFIGDLEGLKSNGEKLVRYTMEYLPEELIEEGSATFVCDWYCVVSSILEMLNCRPRSMTKIALVKAVVELNGNGMHSLLVAILRDKLKLDV